MIFGLTIMGFNLTIKIKLIQVVDIVVNHKVINVLNINFKRWKWTKFYYI